jgi:hypothetical protein
MAAVVGIVLGLLIVVFARLTGLDRDRAFYPTMLIVIALYYILFAVMGGSPRALALESIQLVVFTTVAILGFKSNLWWVAGGLAGHAVFDSVHGYLIANPGVPEWWPSFCLTIDGFLAIVVGLLLHRKAGMTARRFEMRP